METVKDDEQTIFYYTNTHKIIGRNEMTAIRNGFAAPTGGVGVVNRNQIAQIVNGYIQDVEAIKKVSSIIEQDNVIDVLTQIVNKQKTNFATKIKKEELDKMISDSKLRSETTKINNDQNNPDVFINIVNRHSDAVKRGIYPENKKNIVYDMSDKISKNNTIENDVVDVFTDIVNKHSDEAKKRLQQENDDLKNIEPSTIKMKPTLKRGHTIKNIVLGTVIAAVTTISAVGVKYAINFNKIADETYDTLNEYHCYIKNNMDNGKTMVAINDYNELYGQVNPNYIEITDESYNELKNVLISSGYTDKEAAICISSIISPTKVSEFEKEPASFIEKLDYVLDYESKLEQGKGL